MNVEPGGMTSHQQLLRCLVAAAAVPVVWVTVSPELAYIGAWFVVIYMATTFDHFDMYALLLGLPAMLATWVLWPDGRVLLVVPLAILLVAGPMLLWEKVTGKKPKGVDESPRGQFGEW